MRGALGQVGLQMQDVIVQLQAGTNPLTVFVQQGSQIAGAFGPVGAIIGTVGAAVAIAAGAFLGFGRDVDTAKAASDSFRDAQESAREAMGATEKSVDSLRRYYDGLSASMRAVAELDLTNALNKNATSASALAQEVQARLPDLADARMAADVAARSGLTVDPAFTQAVEAIDKAVAGLQGGGQVADFVVELQRIASLSPYAAELLQDTAGSLTDLAKKGDTLRQEAERLQAQVDVLRGKTPTPGILPPSTPPAGGGGGSPGGGVRSSAATVADQARREAEAAAKARQDAMARLLAGQIQIAEAEAEATGKAYAAAYNQSLKDEQQANADEQGSLFAEPAKNALREIQGAFTGFWEDIYSGGLQSAEAYFAQLGDLATRSLASLTSASIMGPVSRFLEGGLKPGSTLGTAIPSLFGGTQFAGVDLNGLGIASGLGAAGGGLVGTMVGGDPLYGSIGGGLGSALGFALGGPLGALAGGGLGSLAGSLIGRLVGGGTGGEHNDNFQYDIDLATGRTSGQNTKPSQENASIVQQLTGRVQSLVDALQDMGGTTAGSINIQSGNNSGLTLDGVKYGNAEDLQLAAFRQIVLATSGLDRNVATAARKSQATDAEEFISDLQFAQNFERLTVSVGDVTAATQELIKSFGEARKRADELGLSAADLAAAQRDQLEARAREIQGSYRAQVESAFGYVDSLSAFRDQLRLGRGSPRVQLGTARSQFEEIAAAARAGDLDAINQLQGAASAYLSAGQNVYASGTGYQQIERIVEGVLNAVIGQGRASERDLLAGIADDQNTVANLTARLAKAQDDVLAALKAINTNLQRALAT